MAIYRVRTFSDIVAAIREELRIQSSDTNALNRIKRTVNSVYVNEVCAYDTWKWLRSDIDLVLNAKITAGTASVTAGSRTVTLTTAPAYSVRGYYFMITGYAERYKIAQHAAGSTILVLESEYTGTTASSQSYALWTDRVYLPSSYRETMQVTTDHLGQPLEGVGIQQFKRHVSTNPQAEGRPAIYSTGDWIDPAPYSTISGLPNLTSRASSGLVKTLVFASTVASYLEVGDRIEISGSSEQSYNGEFEVSSVSTTTITYTALQPLQESATSDGNLLLKLKNQKTNSEKSRELLLHPAKFDKKTTLHVTGIIEPQPLEDDDDEPLMPLEDRIILVYGALMHVWRTLGQNPENASTNATLYDRKLAKMQGLLDDSTDMPRMTPSRSYLSSKRQMARRRTIPSFDGSPFNGGSSGGSSVPTGTANSVAIFNASGELQGSSSVTVTKLENVVDLLTVASVSLNDNQASAAEVTTVNSVSYDHLIIDYNIDRGASNYEAGVLNIKANGASGVTWTQEITATSGSPGVTFDVTISSGTVTWSYTSTSTGTAPSLEYVMRRV